MRLDLAVLPGDGIGKEVVGAALEVLDALGARLGFQVARTECPVGWAAVTANGSPLPEPTLRACRSADAVLLGAVGHPDAEGALPASRPEAGLLALRAGLGCWANLRPVAVSETMAEYSALRPERATGTDLLVVRELAGGLYYGDPRGERDGRAWNTLVYEEHEVRRIAGLALRLARGRGGRVTSVDKANVLEVSRLWRRVVDAVAQREGDVDVRHMLVDRAALEIVRDPGQFDVLLTSNLFGDILSDAAGGVAGSLGVLGSASLGGVTDLYEPVHGSAPELAGLGVANPMGALTSVELMLRHTFGLDRAARALAQAVEATVKQGIRTADLVPSAGQDPLREPVGTAAFTEAVLAHIETGESP